MKHLRNYPLKKLTSFKQSGLIKDFFLFDDILILQNWIRSNRHYDIIGNGSNVLFNSDTYQRPLIKLSPNLSEPIIIGSHTVVMPAAYSIFACQKFLVQHELGGLEFASGVPASIGGMAAMNFSCWNHQISDYINKVHVLLPNGEFEWWTKKECQFNYRSSKLLKEKVLVIEVELTLPSISKPNFQEKRTHFLKLRQKQQPLHECCFGSIFKNPQHILSAGQLIERANFKSKQSGNIKISEAHANFMVNLSPGKGAFVDAIHLIKLVESTIYKQNNIHLDREVIVYE